MTISSEKDARFAEAYNDIAANPTIADVAKTLGVAVQTAKNTAGILRRRRLSDPAVPELVDRKGIAARTVPAVISPIAVPELPSADEPIEELLDRAMRHNERLARRHEAKRLVDLHIHTPGPVAIVGLPDPHLNNPGTILREAFRHADVIRDTEGLFAIGVGDWLDNFIIGRLERERRKEVMTHTDAVRLQEHYVLTIIEKLVAAVGGNHNDWIESLGGTDILKTMFKDFGIEAIYDPDEVRVRLVLPDGSSFTHLVRHIFPGHSKYNSMHGVLSWMLDRWQGEDVIWGGHLHTASSMSLEREWEGNSRIVRGIQLAAYKDIDSYSKKCGFRRNVPFIAPVVVHDPATGKTDFYEDFDRGVWALAQMRDEWRRGLMGMVA